MRRRTTGLVAALAVVLAGTTAAAALHHDGPVVMLPGVSLVNADRMGPPAYTLRDVVTYADHVVAVRVTHDELGTAPADDDAAFWSLRDVDLTVRWVVWSRDGARPAPDHWRMAFFGLAYDVGRLVARRAGNRDEPRVEVGHDYLFVLRWEPARCSHGDPVQPAHWQPARRSA